MVAFLFLNPAGIAALVALMFLSLGTVLPCPPICQICSVYAVECEEVSSLEDVLTTLPSSTQQILLRQGNLSEIPPLAFSNFTNLHLLSITGFLVSSLADLTFFIPYVNYLKILDLSNNQLLSCTIESLAFSGLLYLEELILTNNSLDILRRTWFLEMPGLNKLFLAINRITYLPPRTFENLNKLDELVVSSNMIQYLPMDAFFGLLSLTKLDLSSNKILFINHEAFQPLQALKYLLLFQNRLTTLPGLPNSITFLFIHRNPWVCDCQLIHSMELMQAKIQLPAAVTCKRPPFLAGHQVSSSKLLGCTSSYLSSSLFSTIDLLPSNPRNVKLIFGLLESKAALTMLGVPHSVAKTLSEERWLAACFPGFQPTSVIANCAGDIDSIYEYPSPLVSTTALNTTSFVQMTVTEPIQKNQDQGMDVLQILGTKPVAVTGRSVDLLPPNRMDIRGLSEEIQHPELLLEAVAEGIEQPLEEGDKHAVSPSSNTSYYFFRTGTDPPLQEFPVSIRSCSKVTFSDIAGDINQKSPSITSICPLVERMYQIDFALPVEEEAKPVQGEEWDG
ncbi:reticulon-4 receptor-like 2 [Candoia aspera]|uniref:reticulon-4 receptor-like 2 n=1 Tax=Candoia aspera TaxID=51853 RepID=UPI002FD7CF97